MKLLEAKDVKKDINKKEVEINERLKLIELEENKEISKLNKLREDSERVKKEIEKQTDDFIADQKLKAENAKQEANAIESFRKSVLKELLKPIDDLQTETENRIKEVEKREIDVARREEYVKNLGEELSERIIDIKDREAEIIDKNNECDKRERKCKEEEDRIKKSLEELSKKWIEFSIEVNKANENLKLRENEVADNQKKNEDYFKSLEKVRIEQVNERKGIRDGYYSLAQAKKEILGHE